MTIPAGSREEIVPFSQYDGVNQVWMTDGPTLVPGGKFSGDFDALMESLEEEENQ